MRRAGVVTLFCLMASLLPGCSGDIGALGSLVPSGDTGSQTPKPSAAPTPTEQPPPTALQACDVLSIADVAPLSPFNTPLVAGEEDHAINCFYHPTIDPPAPRAPAIYLTLWDYITPSAAIDGVRSLKQNYEYDGQETAKSLAGLGDEAYTYGELLVSGREDSIFVFAASGRYDGLVHIAGEYKDNRGPDVSVASKVSAASQILELAFSRLP